MSDNTIFSLEIAQSLVDSEEQYPIDFNDAWKWLEFSTKGNGKKSFDKCGFTENLDCKVFIQNDKNPLGGRPTEIIKLTVDCFKCWAMMSNTAKGKKVRQYFLECEKIAKSKSKPLSPAEMFLYSAQKMVELERKQAHLEQQLALEAQRTDHIEALLIQHDAELDRIFNANGHYYSIMGYCSLIGKPIAVAEASALGRQATKICKEYGYSVVPISDPRFGKVNSYPEVVLSQII